MSIRACAGSCDKITANFIPYLILLFWYGITRRALLQMLEDRYGRKSTIIVSQLPVASWYEYIGESTISDAIMDRLAVNAHRFELKGSSLRKKN